MALALPPSEQLKEIRNRLGITTRDVAEFSHRIAQAEDNSEFHISNAWLTQIENSDSVPSIFKLYSLSSIYRIKFSDILLLYGVDLQHLTKHQLSAPLPKTHLTTLEVYDTDKTVSFPVRFDRSCRYSSNICFHAAAWIFAVGVSTPSRSNRQAVTSSGSPSTVATLAVPGRAGVSGR